MKHFKIYHDHIGQIGFNEQEYTNAVFCLHCLVRENEEWIEEFPKGKWSVELCDEDNSSWKTMYTLTTAKIKKLQTQNLF